MGRRVAPLAREGPPRSAAELAEDPSRALLCAASLADRLHLERNMKAFGLEALGFLAVVCLMLASLFCEEPRTEMFEIRQNLADHFSLAELRSVTALEGIYGCLYRFVEAAEALDPLGARHVRSPGPEGAEGPEGSRQPVPSGSEELLLVRAAPFAAATALLLRPQAFLSRARRAPCRGLAERYDALFAAARHAERWRWPLAVRLGGLELSRREPLAPGESRVLGRESEWGSELLRCAGHGANASAPWVERGRGDVGVEIEGTPYFGNVFVDRADILGYMGYRVRDANTTRTPRCLAVPRRDPATLEVLDAAVSLGDADERCERTPRRWIDGWTRRVRAQAFLYTPAAELFTEVSLEFEVQRSGGLRATSRIESFQALRHTARFALWWRLELALVGLCLLQLVLVSVRVMHRRAERSRYRKLEAIQVTAAEAARTSFAVALQLALVASCVQRLVFELWGEDVWMLIEGVMSRNPYTDEQAAVETIEFITRILGYVRASRLIKVQGFVLLCGLFVQLVIYMSIHPRVGLLANTVLKVASDLFHFLVVFGVLYVVLCAMGAWAFGPHVEAFSTLASSLWLGLFWALGAFEGGLEQSLPSGSLAALFRLWTVVFLVVAFLFLLNFLLAIVVDGYAAAKELCNSRVEGNFLRDLALTCRSQLHFALLRWPRRAAILDLLAGLPEGQRGVGCADLERLFAGGAPRLQAARLVLLYLPSVPAAEPEARDAALAGLCRAVSAMERSLGQVHRVLDRAHQRRAGRRDAEAAPGAPELS